MIAEHPVRPRARRQRRFVLENDFLDCPRVPRRRQQREIERQVRTAEVSAVIGNEAVGRQIDFADQHPGIEFVDRAPHFRDHVMDFRLVGRAQRQYPVVRRLPLAKLRIKRVVAKRGILDQVPDHVDAETVDAFAKPEPHHLINGFAHLWVAPVQVRLLAKESMIVILPGRGVIGPRAAAEFRHPVVRRSAIGGRLAPDIPVAFGVIARASALDEPWMPIGGVVRNQIENHLQAGSARGGDQLVKIGHRAE